MRLEVIKLYILQLEQEYLGVSKSF